jgi:hypothetical protein
VEVVFKTEHWLPRLLGVRQPHAAVDIFLRALGAAGVAATAAAALLPAPPHAPARAPAPAPAPARGEKRE